MDSTNIWMNSSLYGETALTAVAFVILLGYQVLILVEVKRRPMSTSLGFNSRARDLSVRAVIRDGEVSDLEADFLRFWMAKHPDLMGLPPLDRMAPALRRLTEGDEALDPGAREALVRLLTEVVGAYDPAE